MKYDQSIPFEEDVEECREFIKRATGGLNTLHIGQKDYNLTSTIDDLLAAIRILERIRGQL